MKRFVLLLLAIGAVQQSPAAENPPLGRDSATQPAERVRGASNAKPNVLFIPIDDLNHWVGHLGRNKQTITPNLDRLAARGVSFSRAYCAAPACNPSRAALMSGRRPFVTGIYHNPDPWKAKLPTAS